MRTIECTICNREHADESCPNATMVWAINPSTRTQSELAEDCAGVAHDLDCKTDDLLDAMAEGRPEDITWAIDQARERISDKGYVVLWDRPNAWTINEVTGGNHDN